jgi:hypothetical protein
MTHVQCEEVVAVIACQAFATGGYPQEAAAVAKQVVHKVMGQSVRRGEGGELETVERDAMRVATCRQGGQEAHHHGEKGQGYSFNHGLQASKNII